MGDCDHGVPAPCDNAAIRVGHAGRAVPRGSGRRGEETLEYMTAHTFTDRIHLVYGLGIAPERSTGGADARSARQILGEATQFIV